MAEKRNRDIGAEILAGIRQIKRDEVGRIVTFPPVADEYHVPELHSGWNCYTEKSARQTV